LHSAAASWEGSVDGEDDGGVAVGEVAIVARNREQRKRTKRRAGSNNPESSVLIAGMFGAPGRPRATHIVQFRAVRVERDGDEPAPEGAEFCQRSCQSGVRLSRGGKRCRTDRSHDAGPCSSNAFFGAENEFSPDSLKDSFNCLDLGGHGVYPVFIRGERMENGFPRLPFGGRAATSAAAKFP
jgi:hypothetical protein